MSTPDTSADAPTPAPSEVIAGIHAPDDDNGIGWIRAIITGVVILAVCFGGAVVGSNAILTKSLALTRTAREWLATGLFFFVVIVVAVALRLLQRRRLV